ncbi:MAG: HIT family protein [Acidimicrobiia bacterium]|nr:HIT family protein [Acidimicrobiia bacterium]MDH5520415.1 HIT family protein [Acidimicrobiia bacterium]
MASIFTRIIDGDIPGRIIWADDVCVAMVDIRPLHPGHCLVIPRAEVDQWTDLDTATAQHLMAVAHHIGDAQKATVACERIGLMIAGFEVPHAHVHVVPISSMAHLDFRNADSNAQAGDLDAVADRLRATLRAAGHTAVAG